MSSEDAATLIGALSALIVALGGLIYQVRAMRRDIVDAVASHKDETIQVLRESMNGIPQEGRQ